MTRRLKISLLLSLVCVLVFQSTTVNAQAYKEAIGYSALVLEIGAALENGSGVKVMQAEAPATVFQRNAAGSFVLDGDGDKIPIPDEGTYLPNPGDSQFTSVPVKSFTDGTGTNYVNEFGFIEYNGHALAVGKNFYGNVSSMTKGITDITVYDANHYLNNILDVPAADVGNHSYIGNGITTAQAEDLLERFDFVINRDNTVMVVGANNGSGNVTPQLLAPSFNAITVGRSDGNHSQTLTSVYETPRFAVEIVVPAAGATSFSTPVVGSAAALLKHAGTGSNFVQNEVIRATLFAGATKDEFASWDRTATRPLDEVFGYGELNILNSYHIFEGGEFEGSTSDPAMNVGLLGWDYGAFDGTNDLFYDFSIDPDRIGELSTILSWNMDITDTQGGPAFVASRSLADLNLDLFDSSGSFLGTLLDSSNGADYNNEHIFFEGLASGDYTLQVSGNLATDFGLAWMVTTVPEPSSLTVLGLLSLGILTRRRRRSAIA